MSYCYNCGFAPDYDYLNTAYKDLRMKGRPLWGSDYHGPKESFVESYSPCRSCTPQCGMAARSFYDKMYAKNYEKLARKYH
jgi:hypothetical protein